MVRRVDEISPAARLRAAKTCRYGLALVADHIIKLCQESAA